ncbi:MAG: hypothetical protein K6G33_13240 [Ruminococcus sp.]|uniref:hypothetical protein n=1 Tax=Ruminococcus sp. TaxID=41978 RepID=UPI0025F27999|nr:hypothetical protein [Ruminococcus sp.]MCR5601694.1 hypothetical protein [Ruminococcus sp.]
MKNNRLPDSKEWDKIVADAFSSTENHDFSVKYELRKAQIQKGITMNNSSNYIRRRYIGMVAAAAAIVITVPATVYAFTNGKTAVDPKNEVSTTVKTTTEAAETTTLADAAEVITDKLTFEKYENDEYRYLLSYNPTEKVTSDNQKYVVEYTFLPSDFSNGVEEYDNLYITPAGGGFNPKYYRVILERPVKEKIDSVVNFEEISDENIEAFIIYRSNVLTDSTEPAHCSNRLVYVHFKNTNYFAELTVTDDISDDDVRSIINGMKLVPSDSENTHEWYGNVDTDDIIVNTDYTNPTCAVDEIKTAKIGDTLSFEAGNQDGTTNALELTINNAWIQDNFDGINTDIHGNQRDFSQFLSDDGKIYDTINWIKYGNGRDSLDENVKSETFQLKVVVLDLTYTNNSDNDMINSYDAGGENKSLTVCPQVFDFSNNTISFNKIDGINEPVPYPSIDINNSSIFSLDAGDSTSKFGLDIPAHKSTNAKMAILVRADQLDDTYIELLGYDCADFNDYIEKDCFFPVKSIK